jgi:hypothetical protein
MIAVTNLPAQAPAATMSFFVEGYSEQIGDETYTIDFNLSPAELSPTPWIFEDPVYGQYDAYGLGL